ncbi:MAG: putative Ig domain-containing protein [Planctomycetaceae bacterium]
MPPDDMFLDPASLLTWTPITPGPVEIEIKVKDALGGYAVQSFTLTVQSEPTPDNAPVFNSLPPIPARVGQLYRYQVSAYDPDGTALIYNLDVAPSGMVISPDGLVTWTPQVVGDFDMTIKITDGAGSSATQSIPLPVLPPVVLNDPPTITSSPAGPAVRGRLYEYQVTTFDPNGDAVVVELDAASYVGDMYLDPVTYLLTWTPASAGSVALRFTATDAHGATSVQQFTLPVVNNAPPLITSLPIQTANVDELLTDTVTGADPNTEDTLTFSLGEAPEGMAIDPITGELSWTPAAIGMYSVTVIVSDQEGAAGEQTYDLLVIDPANNNPPIFTAEPPEEIPFGVPFVYQFVAEDPDDDPLTFGLDGWHPAGMEMDELGLLQWTPNAGDADLTHEFTVAVTDGRSDPVLKEFSIRVSGRSDNQPPEFTTAPSNNAVANMPYQYPAHAVDPDGDTIVYSLPKKPAGMSINPATGKITWTPTYAQSGVHDVVLRVTDSFGASAEQHFSITSRTLNRPPRFESDPVTTGYAEELYTYAVRAVDPDDHILTYSVSAIGENDEPVTGISIDPEHVVRWETPAIGNYRVTVTVVDELGFGIQQIYTLVISDGDADAPPVINSDPGYVASVGEQYRYLVNAFDPDGDELVLTLDAASLARGMSFNPDNPAEILWTPAEEHLTYEDIYYVTVTATANGLTASQRYPLQVRDVNTPPVITLNAPTAVTAGLTYRYDVDAVDQDGDPLTYQLTMAPEGMTIDPYGRITWVTTANTPIADYTVEILVSDDRGGQDAASFVLKVLKDDTKPKVSVTVDKPVANIGDEITISVKAVDDVGISEIILLVGGERVAVDGSGIARVTFDDAGSIPIVATAKDKAGNVSLPANAGVLIRDPANEGDPDAILHLATAKQIVAEPLDILATVADDVAIASYTLTLISHETGKQFELATGNAAVDHEIIGRIDSTLLANGVYTLELKAMDTGGNTATDSRVVEIDSDLKMGNFSLTFTDLEIPLGGLPITVTRTYNTLDADEQGDFGYGWSLDLSNTKVKVVQPSGGDVGLFGYPPFKDGTRVEVTLPDGTVEGFTFYGKPGTVFGSAILDYLPTFVADVGVKSELYVSGLSLRKDSSTGEYYDLETGHTYSPADPAFGGAYILRLRNGVELAINAETGDMAAITDRNGNELNFTGMGIEHSSGRGIQFERDYAGRITAIIDPMGQRLEYAYDHNGNLIAFTDRRGGVTQYTYLEGQNAPEHYLDQIIDPLGRQAARSVYDEQGRLVTLIDAQGKTIQFAYDVEGKTKTITDQLGNVTTQHLDADGNILREVDPLGGTVIRTFGDDHQLLSETIVIGQEDSAANGQTNDLTTTYIYNASDDLIQTVDSRGNSSGTTYNEYGQPLTQTDTLGNTTTTYYNDRGLPTAIRDANGNITSLNFDDRGNLTKIKDSNGNTLVTNTYNQYGEILSTTPITGRTTFFEYNENGDQTASWFFEESGEDLLKILTETAYDENRNVTGTTNKRITHPGQSGETTVTVWSTSTEYDANGQVIRSTDQYGNVSENLYDTRGRLIESRNITRNPDGSTAVLLSRTVYDAAGRAVVTTNTYKEGTAEPITGSRTTYDAAGRVVQTESLTGVEIVITIDGNANDFVSAIATVGSVFAARGTTFDTAGRVTATTDQYGNVTQTTYNDAGDVIQTRSESKDENGDIAFLLSQTVYDEYGRAVVSTDRYLEDGEDPVLGTRTIYDDKGRVVRSERLTGVIIEIEDGDTEIVDYGTVLYATQTVYDSKGRVAKNIAADGQTTTYEYDSLNRRIATIAHAVDPASVGLIPPTGAVSVALRTETVYDDQGRVEAERTNIAQFFNAAGVTVSIDASAVRETSYEYDIYGQVVKTTFADGNFISMAYDDVGRTVAETNQLGLTRTFDYDHQGRLVAVELPAVVDPSNGNVLVRPRYEYEFDALGNQTSIRDPLGRETRFTFDDRGQQLSRTLPLGIGTEDDFTERMEYDIFGRQVLAITFEGKVIRFVYDEGTETEKGTGRLLAKEFFDNLSTYDNGNGTPAETIAFSYDAFGRLVAVVDERGETTYEYDPRGQLIRTVSPEGAINYEYDVLGRKIRTSTGPANDPVNDFTYEYDALGRLAKVTVIERNDVPLTTPEHTAYAYGVSSK